MQTLTDYAILSKEKEDYILVPDIMPIEGKPQDDSSANNGSSLKATTEAAQAIQRSGITDFVLHIPSASAVSHSRFKVLQIFEGTVVQIDSKECHAVIRDLTTKGFVEEVVFPIDEISEGDRKLALPGSVFYWYLGYNDHIDGQRYRSSAIIFRRLPVWREKDLMDAQKKAEYLMGQIGWSTREDPSINR